MNTSTRHAPVTTVVRPALPAAVLRALGIAAAALAFAVPAAHAQSPCLADLDGNGVVGAADLARLLGNWGACPGCPSDINDDGQVNAADLSTLLGFWGESCAPLPWATVLEFEPNPSVVTNSSLRAAIAATGLPWRVRDNGTNIEMTLIPPGLFIMGCSPSNAFPCYDQESPAHFVTLTNAYYMGRYEVTQAQWTAQTGSNPSSFQSASAQVPAQQVPSRPVESVTVAAIEGFLAATNLRLPTEAEWEYACRAGTATAFHGFAGVPNGTNDDTLFGDIAWFGLNGNGQTHPVGQKAQNGFGLFDMSGNVIEYVSDWYSETYYSSSPSTNPTGPATGTYRVIRGGGWGFTSRFGRSSWRGFTSAPGGADYHYGFRVARNP